MGLACTLMLSSCASGGRSAQIFVHGTVWQPDYATIHPKGQWHHLGAQALLVQWSIVDSVAFVIGTSVPVADPLPDWGRIAKEPWAQEVILGLAGHFDENVSRSDLPRLIKLSQQLTQLPTPLNVVGWYFPVEVDPTWSEAHLLAKYFEQLPRPLWISVYDSANLGPEALADSLATWLPTDVGVFFQDGVGIYARSAAVAVRYADVLVARLGVHRVKLIAEAFRPQIGGGFRSATAAELLSQLSLYKNHRVYLFDGPHYVPDTLVNELHQSMSMPTK